MCKVSTIFFTLGTTFLSACGGGSSSDSASNRPSSGSASAPSHGTEKALGIVLSDVVWEQRVLPVCWKMSKEYFDTYQNKRDLVQQSVAQSWEQASAVRFTGWELCSAENTDVAISIGLEDRPGFLGFSKYGKMSLLAHPSMTLNLKEINGVLLKSVAIHEFGHALGFAHEQDRPDTPQWCIDHIQARYASQPNAIQDQTKAGHTVEISGSWDEQSIMNYCNETRHVAPELSETDKAKVAFYYGAPIP